MGAATPRVAVSGPDHEPVLATDVRLCRRGYLVTWAVGVAEQLSIELRERPRVWTVKHDLAHEGSGTAVAEAGSTRLRRPSCTDTRTARRSRHLPRSSQPLRLRLDLRQRRLWIQLGLPITSMGADDTEGRSESSSPRSTQPPDTPHSGAWSQTATASRDYCNYAIYGRRDAHILKWCPCAGRRAPVSAFPEFGRQLGLSG